MFILEKRQEGDDLAVYKYLGEGVKKEEECRVRGNQKQDPGVSEKE